MTDLMASIAQLSSEEKLQLFEELWEELSATPEAVPVHDWQKAELDRRHAKLLAEPDALVSWEEIKRRARSQNEALAFPSPSRQSSIFALPIPGMKDSVAALAKSFCSLWRSRWSD